MYVPQLYTHWDFLSELNTHLRNYNARQGYSRYPLSKVATRDCPGGQMKIRQSFWQEYIQGTGYGYHLTNNGKRILGKFIRRFHFDGFTGNHVGQNQPHDDIVRQPINFPIWP